MSSYALTQAAPETPHANHPSYSYAVPSGYDRLQAFQASFQSPVGLKHYPNNNNNGVHPHQQQQQQQQQTPNFSVSHLLDLEELPRENCAMYAEDGSSDPAASGHTMPPQHSVLSTQATHPASCMRAADNASPDSHKLSGEFLILVSIRMRDDCFHMLRMSQCFVYTCIYLYIIIHTCTCICGLNLIVPYYNYNSARC